MELANRMARLGTETAFEMNALVGKLRREGKDIITFGIGEPDFDTPKNIKDACIKALNDNQTHYTTSNGILPLRHAIAKVAGGFRVLEIDPDEVIVSSGAKHIIYDLITALVNAGDEVIYPNPGYPIYESIANFVGAKSVALPLWESRNFSFDASVLKKLVNKKTKMIILNSPHNPTGGVLSVKDLQDIAEITKDFNCWIMMDEIYSRMIYDEKFTSLASLPGMKERTLIVDGFSKTFAMTGWRLGYGIMPKELAVYVAKLENNTNSCISTFSQYGAIEAMLGDQSPMDKMTVEYKKRRDLIVKLLNDIKGFSCKSPKGAFYAFPNVTQACKNLGLKDARELQNYILDKAGVAVLARTYFGPKNEGENDEYVRLSYVTSTDTIEKGLARIKKVIEQK
ncbi:MAG: pyridoxal phosphate-dependent aminotransferase [Candidatus Firestonebacteria bacterium]